MGGVNTFSPEGRIYQIEYAIKSVKYGSTAIGIKTNEGVVLGIEKKLPSGILMVKAGKTEKLVEIDHARVEAQNHTFNYAEPMDIQAITQSVSDVAINFGEGYAGSKRKAMARPYGVGLLIAGVDAKGPQLY